MALPEYLKRKIAEFGMPPDVEHDPTQLAQMQPPALTATAPSSEVQPVKMPLSQALDPAYEPSMQPKPIPLQANPALNAATTGNMARLPGPISTPSRLDQLQAKYDTLNQSPTLKGTLLRSLAVALPTLAGAEFGGIYGASGAAQGAASGLEEATQQRNLQKQAAYKSLEDELQRQERMGERKMTTGEKASEAALREKEIEATNAQRMAGITGTNQAREDIQGLKNLIGQQAVDVKSNALDQKTTQQQQALDAQMQRGGFEKDPDSGQYVETAEHKARGQAITDHTQALADLAKAGNDPTSAKYKLALLHVQQTGARLDLSNKQFELRSQGTVNGVAPAGILIADSGAPVGTAMQQNVRPTGAQRRTGNLAESAHEQLSDIKSIVQKRPDIFGPAAGRKTDFTVWVGSQDPDAQKFRAARTIAGDHLAGVFGGRSEPALQALDEAIGHFKDNPAAISAGIDQLDKANQTFIKAGAVNTVGSDKGNKKLADALTVRVQIPGQPPGKISKANLAQFLKENPGAKQLP